MFILIICIQRKKMFKKIKTYIAVSLFALVSACGGGGDGEAPSPLYGAIAINPNSVLTTGITENQESESAASFRAEVNCGDGCVAQRVFSSPDKCGAVALATGQGISAWGVGTNFNNAENLALLKCRDAGGAFCFIIHSRCNDR
jgi:hypothetical protein